MTKLYAEQSKARYKAVKESGGQIGVFGHVQFIQKDFHNFCDLVEAPLLAKIEKLREALQALYDEQNGPPLIRDKADWEAAMAKAGKALEESNDT